MNASCPAHPILLRHSNLYMYNHRRATSTCSEAYAGRKTRCRWNINSEGQEPITCIMIMYVVFCILPPESTILAKRTGRCLLPVVSGDIVYKHFFLKIRWFTITHAGSDSQLRILLLRLFHPHYCCYCLLFIPPSVIIISVFSSVVRYSSNHLFFEGVFNFTSRVQLFFSTFSLHFAKKLWLCLPHSFCNFNRPFPQSQSSGFNGWSSMRWIGFRG
jgi:hypothetical protein